MNACVYFHLLRLLRFQLPPTRLSLTQTHTHFCSVQFQINNNGTTGGQTRHASHTVTRSNSPTHTLQPHVCVCVCNMSSCVRIKVNVKEGINTRIISELISYLESLSLTQ